MNMKLAAIAVLAVAGSYVPTGLLPAAEPVELSGIYPHLAMFNDEGECGTGAVVPWAGRLWVVTYAPHAPKGSSDKLYEILPDLTQIIRPESIGGTPANRMIHRESQQLFIGPYAIDDQRKVRVIPYSKMFGRPTGTARHLFDPAGKVYYATMEEGIYEVDVKSLDVNELWQDERLKTARHADLPGYHGKGFYAAQGKLIYANNGEHGGEALKNPAIPSGVLAAWDGKAEAWEIVRRNQFTEVTGPGGIEGAKEDHDPVWSIGWDHRSLILMCLDEGKWHSYRLPKASHSYDGAHGWNTEWPRIRDIGEEDLLMTMHGMFWKFPRTFCAKNTAGIAPRSTYLKVVGDFCRWNDRIVLGCDDTAKNEFLNKRKAKGEIAAPQSQSNLWFLEPKQLDQLGPIAAHGGVWIDEDVVAKTPSDPFLVAGFSQVAVHLSHATQQDAKIRLEVDDVGDGDWKLMQEIDLTAAKPISWVEVKWPAGNASSPHVWMRATSNIDLKHATVWFSMNNEDNRSTERNKMFAGLAEATERKMTGGVVRARGENKRTLHFVAQEPTADGVKDVGLYELDAELKLRHVDDASALKYQQEHAAIPVGVLSADAASVIFTDDAGRRWRLPRGGDAYDQKHPFASTRVCREVATERDLFNAYGTFFELPAENAGGFAKVRAVATHNCRVVDYCSYRGLFIMSGVAKEAANDNRHILRSDDGKTALWAGAIDDVWQMGKPRGFGGPWKMTAVKKGQASDPYLMNGYGNHQELTLSHDHDSAVKFKVEGDVTGTGLWREVAVLEVPAGKDFRILLTSNFCASWLRIVPDADCTATAQLKYD